MSRSALMVARIEFLIVCLWDGLMLGIPALVALRREASEALVLTDPTQAWSLLTLWGMGTVIQVIRLRRYRRDRFITALAGEPVLSLVEWYWAERDWPRRDENVRQH